MGKLKEGVKYLLVGAGSAVLGAYALRYVDRLVAKRGGDPQLKNPGEAPELPPAQQLSPLAFGFGLPSMMSMGIGLPMGMPAWALPQPVQMPYQARNPGRPPVTVEVDEDEDDGLSPDDRAMLAEFGELE